MKEIPLTRGLHAIVDDEDYEWLNRHKWCALKHKSTFYAVRGVGPRKNFSTVFMHRDILNPSPGMETDHRNGNGLDNRRCNLRECTRSQNNANQRSHRGSTSKFRGVSWCDHSKRWVAQLNHNGTRVLFKRFSTEQEAALAYNDAALKYFGEFARLNVITEAEHENA